MLDRICGLRVARWLGVATLIAVPALSGCEEGGTQEQGGGGESQVDELQREAQQAWQQQEGLLERQQEVQQEAQETRSQQEQLAQREQQLEQEAQQTEQQLQEQQARSQQLDQRAEQQEQQREQQLAQQQQQQEAQQQQADQQQQQRQQEQQQQAQARLQEQEQEQTRSQQQEQQRFQQEQQAQQARLQQQEQQPQPQEQQPQQQARTQQQLQQGGAAALGAAGGAAIAGGGQQQQPVIEGQVRGTVREVNLARGSVTLEAGERSVRLRAQPSDIADLNQGDAVSLPFASYGDAQWVTGEGGDQGMAQMFQSTQEVQGVVSNVDKDNGTITIEGQELSGHPQQLEQVMPGQSVTAQIAQVENTPWIAQIETSGATAQAGQQQQQGGEPQVQG